MRYTEIMPTGQHIMRKWIALCESKPGMLAVKTDLGKQLETVEAEGDAEAHDELITQWGIMDDLWITGTGGLMLHRAIRLKQPWQKHLQKNGHHYWSTSLGGATAYDADALDLAGTVKITAELPADASVDWNEIWRTIVLSFMNEARMSYSLDQVFR